MGHGKGYEGMEKWDCRKTRGLACLDSAQKQTGGYIYFRVYSVGFIEL